jgi:hypothetical protein
VKVKYQTPEFSLPHARSKVRCCISDCSYSRIRLQYQIIELTLRLFAAGRADLWYCARSSDGLEHLPSKLRPLIAPKWTGEESQGPTDTILISQTSNSGLCWTQVDPKISM